MTLCTAITKQYKTTIKCHSKVKGNDKIKGIVMSGSTSGLLHHIEGMIGDMKEFGYCQPYDLLRDLLQLEDRKMPLYSYDGDIKSLHVETQALIRLGFAYIEDQYLHADRELVKVYICLQQIKEIRIMKRKLSRLKVDL